mmetsp:Transcript_13485/g.33743  ORF Transcript_13485/g.33743 Transcript_13485/m.33743 type:complete len:228 (+) Transcript_13485:155-838(+)
MAAMPPSADWIATLRHPLRRLRAKHHPWAREVRRRNPTGWVPSSRVFFRRCENFGWMHVQSGCVRFPKTMVARRHWLLMLPQTHFYLDGTPPPVRTGSARARMHSPHLVIRGRTCLTWTGCGHLTPSQRRAFDCASRRWRMSGHRRWRRIDAPPWTCACELRQRRRRRRLLMRRTMVVASTTRATIQGILWKRSLRQWMPCICTIARTRTAAARRVKRMVANITMLW